jgi:predicted transcriptional regulator
MKNTPTDMTNLLIELMERLSDEELTEDKLNEEINRSKTVADLSKNVLSIWNFQLRVAQAKDAAVSPDKFKLPEALED